MLEGSTHEPLALLEDESGGIGHTLQGLTHTSHYNAHEVASAMAQQVVDGWLTHGTYTWKEARSTPEQNDQERRECGKGTHSALLLTGLVYVPSVPMPPRRGKQMGQKVWRREGCGKTQHISLGGNVSTLQE